MSTWLAEQHCDLVKDWVHKSDSCFVASGENGKILWANESFQKMVKYNLLELRKLTWEDISIHDVGLDADKELAVQCIEGKITEYRVRKQYLPKGESPLPCDLHVMRQPLEGKFEVLLVTVRPITHQGADVSKMLLEGHSKIIECFSTLQKTLSEQTDEEKLATSMARMVRKYPKISIAIALICLGLVLGSSALEIVAKVLKLGLPLP